MPPPNRQWNLPPVPQIDEVRCTGCGLCIQVCPNQVLGLVGGVVRATQPNRCDYTGYCELICPSQAINRFFQIIYLSRKDRKIMQNMKFHWVEKVSFSSEGPQPYPLLEDDSIKFVLAGLEPGQRIPAHPVPSAVYYFIEGTGRMTVDGTPIEIEPGVIIRTPDGAQRSIDADTRLIFLGAHTK